MTKCSQCGAENKDGARFCESCGAPLQQANQGNPTFCPQCGAQLAPGASFCPSCGYRVGGPVQNGPAPMYNQGYPQQPYGYPQPAPVIKTQEKVSLVRSLIVSIGLFATIALVIVSLLVEVAKGSSMNIIEILKPLFESFKDAKGCSLINFVAETLICVLPVVGVAIFAPIAIATGIKAIIKKSLPKYGPCGAVLGFAAPYFYFWTCLALETPDNKGFLFPKVAEYPALLLFLGAVGVYVVVGLVNAYMSAIENKRNLAAPIVKTFAAILGVAAIVFIFTPLIAITYKDSSDAISYSSESPMAMWTAISVLIAFMGDSIKFEPLLPIFAVIFLSSNADIRAIKRALISSIFLPTEPVIRRYAALNPAAL